MKPCRNCGEDSGYPFNADCPHCGMKQRSPVAIGMGLLMFLGAVVGVPMLFDKYPGAAWLFGPLFGGGMIILMLGLDNRPEERPSSNTSG